MKPSSLSPERELVAEAVGDVGGQAEELHQQADHRNTLAALGPEQLQNLRYLDCHRLAGKLRSKHDRCDKAEGTITQHGSGNDDNPQRLADCRFQAFHCKKVEIESDRWVLSGIFSF